MERRDRSNAPERSIVHAECRESSIADLVETSEWFSPWRRMVQSRDIGSCGLEPIDLPGGAEGRLGASRSSTSRRSPTRPRSSSPIPPAGGPVSPASGAAVTSSARLVTASTHSSGRRGQDPRLAGSDHLGMGPDRVGDDRQTGRLVLKDLESAFSAAPEVVRQPTDPDLSGRELTGLGRFAPGDGNDPEWETTRESGRRSAEDSGAEGPLLEPLPDCSRFFQSPQRARGTDPDEIDPTSAKTRGTRSGSAADQHTWESRALVRLWPRLAGTVRQEVVACDDGVGQPHRLREPAKTPGTLVTTSIVGVTEEDRVVEIEDEMPRSWRRTRNCQSGKSLRCKTTASNWRARRSWKRRGARPRSNPWHTATIPRRRSGWRKGPNAVSTTDVVR